ncbi:unnamed protein product [Notodromas monacha]|uniref:Cytochrome c oxidase subunit n=1 Tax=Notodromas monacha TaxID=399045 RepID=A0A7R9BST1_9CRUS|nr:unnamed protein product [Notodromas monacha]CAG0919454.1 unnamed protein product [Notodromas monacha]
MRGSIQATSFLRRGIAQSNVLQNKSGGGGHQGGALLWKRLTFFGAFPAIGLCAVSTAMDIKNHPHDPPEFIPYEHLRIRTKRFPWGDGNKTFFHNPHANALPEGYEPGHGPGTKSHGKSESKKGAEKSGNGKEKKAEKKENGNGKEAKKEGNGKDKDKPKEDAPKTKEVSFDNSIGDLNAAASWPPVNLDRSSAQDSMNRQPHHHPRPVNADYPPMYRNFPELQNPRQGGRAKERFSDDH